ncbi:CPCC family cysteine-rich protein [Streptomyces finlayi]|uniref:CPCC family cysteine-rich protein n=1 Tax=Streptomyces finlayi TaxID=67296 RepID=UPI0035BC136F
MACVGSRRPFTGALRTGCGLAGQESDSYPCPCCGNRVLDAMPGSYEICPVCFWEDDGVQFRWPTMAGGANKVSLPPFEATEAPVGDNIFVTPTWIDRTGLHPER